LSRARQIDYPSIPATAAHSALEGKTFDETKWAGKYVALHKRFVEYLNAAESIVAFETQLSSSSRNGKRSLYDALRKGAYFSAKESESTNYHQKPNMLIWALQRGYPRPKKDDQPMTLKDFERHTRGGPRPHTPIDPWTKWTMLDI